MALKTVDLTQQPERAVFSGCSQEEVSYAKSFWQSIQLLPPMESRLVSSDIKQRLRKAPPSRSMSELRSFDLSDTSCHLCHSLTVTIANSSCHLGDEFGNTYLVDLADVRDQLVNTLPVQNCSNSAEKQGGGPKKKSEGPHVPPGFIHDPLTGMIIPEEPVEFLTKEEHKQRKKRPLCRGYCVITWGERTRLVQTEGELYEQFVECSGEAMRKRKLKDEESAASSMLNEADREPEVPPDYEAPQEETHTGDTATAKSFGKIKGLTPEEMEKDKYNIVENKGSKKKQKPAPGPPSKVICWMDQRIEEVQEGLAWVQSSTDLKKATEFPCPPELDTEAMPGYIKRNINTATSPDSHGITPEGAVFPCVLSPGHGKSMKCDVYPRPPAPPRVYMGWAPRVDMLTARGRRDSSKDRLFKFPNLLALFYGNCCDGGDCGVGGGRGSSNAWGFAGHWSWGFLSRLPAPALDILPGISPSSEAELLAVCPDGYDTTENIDFVPDTALIL